MDALTDHFLRVVPPHSVTWVHPSWRDVAIEALADDEEQRLRFLHACEVDGLQLALSVAGGAAGGRSLPLLRTDADWDALADRLHDVLRYGRDEDVVRLLDVLETALAAPLGERAEAEVVALAEHALDMAAAGSTRSRRPRRSTCWWAGWSSAPRSARPWCIRRSSRPGSSSCRRRAATSTSPRSAGATRRGRGSHGRSGTTPTRRSSAWAATS